METVTYSQIQDLVQQLPLQCLPAAYEMLRELSAQNEGLRAQVEFMHLPLAKRREILENQAEALQSHYSENASERAEWQAGDFADESAAV